MKLRLKVVPGGSRDEVVGMLGDALKIRVAAPPERGRANRAVLRLLAEFFDVPGDAVTLLSGAASPLKMVEVAGVDAESLQRRLAALRG
jgi:uncharacterized protein (TIGR00251 family)